jgi:hypothetical protein
MLKMQFLSRLPSSIQIVLTGMQETLDELAE